MKLSYEDNVCLDIISTGPYYEHMKDFHKSFFKSVYKRAFLQLNEIIYNFRKNSKNGLTLTDRGYYEDSAVKINSGYENFSNIITFVGKRGSGKSSVMLSFMEALRHYYSYKRMSNNGLPYELKYIDDPLFSCLDCIDGSLLEHGEDIFKIVLAQMYQKFIDLDKNNGIYKDEDFAYRKRELLQQLEGIYRTVCDIENMEYKDALAGESYMSSLQSLSSSQKVKRDFEELIKRFTSLMKYERPGLREESYDHFVVITIDDIDLNVNSGFSMLEKIHRYCMVQNVIVLLSVDIEQMLSIVSKNFYKVLPEVDKLLRDGQKQVQELSVDYLNKVMPVNYRLYIPELNNYYSSNDIFVKKEKLGIKQSVFGKIYRRIGIYFDSQGIKRHFYEPKSMRQLSCFYLMLETMETLDLQDVYYEVEIDEEKRDHFVRVWEENYRLLTADLWNRIVVEKLFAEKEVVELCEMINKEDIRRAKDRVVNFNIMDYSAGQYCPYIGGSTERSIYKSQYVENCSYGQLVEAIYQLGRKAGDKFKPLVYYLLGYFSYAFTRIYIYEKLSVKINEEIVKKGTFKALIGKNIVDNWSNLMMPHTIEVHDTDIGENLNNKSLKSLSNFKEVVLTNILTFPVKDIEKFKDDNGTIDNNRKYMYVAKLIRDLELTVLFLVDIREAGQSGIIDSDSFSWEFKLNDKDGKIRIEFLPKIEGSPNISLAGDYSILNFVGNSMDAVQRLEEFERGIIDCLAEDYQLYTEKNTKDKVFENQLEKYSLKTKYKKWEEQFGKQTLPLPVYWFDFTYNVLKRVKRKMNREFIVSQNVEDMYTCIQKLYASIREQLIDQQNFYSFKEEKTRYCYRLVECYERCPVVEYFLQEIEEEEKKEFINGMMTRLIDYSMEDK